MCKRSIATPILVLLMGWTVSVYGVDPDPDVLAKARTSAAQAAEAAAQAAQAAAQAAEAASKAAEAAKQASAKADAASYEAYALQMRWHREERLNTLPAPSIPPQTNQPVNNEIDRFITAKWPDGTESELCDDYTFIRRVYLDVVGYIPTVDEINNFVAYKSDNKRQLLIDALLERNEDYAIHWTPFWEDALASNGNHQGGIGTNANFQQFILDSFRQNKPYDLFVSQLIDPQAALFKPGFVKSANQNESLATAANVGQVFLGTAMKCATCHDDFLNTEWPQTRFYGFASFFSDADLEITRCEVKKGVFAKPAFIFDNVKSGPAELKGLNERLSAVAQALVDPTNPRFATTFVNRLWKRSMGMGLIEPVDETRVDVPASHPELLQWLAYDFIAHDYDIKHTIRVILNSRTYQQKYEPSFADVYQSGRDLPRYFRSPGHRRLTCEQTLDSLTVALKSDKPRSYSVPDATGLTLALGRPASRNEISTQRPDDVAVIQALEFINGSDLHERIYNAPLITELCSMPDRDKAIHQAFLSVLSRPPKDTELKQTNDFLAVSSTPQDWSDMIWALAVTPEFQYVR